MNGEINIGLYNTLMESPACNKVNITCSNSNEILSALEKKYNGNWTYEISSDEDVFIVILYLPDHLPIICTSAHMGYRENIIGETIFKTLSTMGIISSPEETKEQIPVKALTTEPIGKVGEDITDMGVEEFNQRYVNPLKEEIQKAVSSETFNQEIEKDAEAVMRSTATKQKPVDSPEMVFKKIDLQFKPGETEEQYYGRINETFNQIMVDANSKGLKYDYLMNINSTDVPNEIAVYVQYYAKLFDSFGKQETQETQQSISWISGKPIHLDEDVRYGISEPERKKWKHLTSKEIYIEKVVDLYNDLPDRLVPAMTKRFKAQGFQSMLITPQMAEIIDKRVYVKLKLMGHEPTIENCFGNLGKAPELSTKEKALAQQAAGIPTPPMEVDFNNPSQLCPKEVMEPVVTGWNEDHTVETIVVPDQMKYYVPPKNKIPFTPTGVNEAGVPINRWNYTELQMDRMQSFKEQHEIDNDDKFGQYVSTWSNGKFQKKTDVNPGNIEEFLTWTESLQLGKALWR